MRLKAKTYLEDLGLQDWKITLPDDGGHGVQTMWISELMDDFYLESPSCPNCGGKEL